MKNIITALGILFLLLIFIFGCLALRLFYIDFLTDSAHIRVVNYSPKELDVSLTFPSKKTRVMRLEPKSYEDFQVGGTGEGSISIKINDREPILTGYVTSINPPMLISIGDDLSVELELIKKQNKSK